MWSLCCGRQSKLVPCWSVSFPSRWEVVPVGRQVAVGSSCCCPPDCCHTSLCIAVFSDRPRSWSWCCGQHSKACLRAYGVAPSLLAVLQCRLWSHRWPSSRLGSSWVSRFWVPSWVNWYQSGPPAAFDFDGGFFPWPCSDPCGPAARRQKLAAESRWLFSCCDRRSTFCPDCLLFFPIRQAISLGRPQRSLTGRALAVHSTPRRR